MLRTGGRSCNCCGVIAEVTQKLLLCSACKSAQYCNKECQTKHWKQHKPICKQAREGKKAAAENLGKEFVDYSDRWRKQHTTVLSIIASISVGSQQHKTHVLALFCDYSSERDSRAKIQVDHVECLSLSTVAERYGVQCLQACTSLANSGTLVATSDYFMVLTFIQNLDSTDDTPLCKISHLGCDKSMTPQQTVKMYIAQLNRGDYES